jgi:hypothetical protein
MAEIEGNRKPGAWQRGSAVLKIENCPPPKNSLSKPQTSVCSAKMKRLLDWLFNGLALLSLLLCIAMVVLWVRSVDHWDDKSIGPNATIVSQNHNLTLYVTETVNPPHPLSPGEDWASREFFGFGWWKWAASAADASGRKILYGYTTGYWVKDWLIVVITGFLPASAFILWFNTRRQTNRGKKNICRVCGYDLRATPYRCPECGTVPRRSR